jgi:hypothetical protein
MEYARSRGTLESDATKKTREALTGRDIPCLFWKGLARIVDDFSGGKPVLISINPVGWVCFITQ